MLLYLCGPDDFLISRQAKTWWEEKTRDITDDFGKEIVTGECQVVDDVAPAVNRLAEAVQTMPMFGDRKVIWFKDINFLADTPMGRSEDTLAAVEKLVAILSDMPASGVDVLLTASPVDRRKRGHLDLAKIGEHRFIGESAADAKKSGGGPSAMLLQLAKDEAASAGVKLNGDALDLLIARTGGGSRMLIEEIAKLATYLGEPGAVITSQLVAEMVPDISEQDFFEVTTHFESGDIPATLRALQKHFFQNKEGARPIISALQNRNRLLIQLRALLDAKLITPRVNAHELAKAAEIHGHWFDGLEEKSSANLFTQNAFYLSRLAQSAAKPGNTLRRLLGQQQDFIKAFTALIESGRDQEERVLRDLVVRCLS